MSTETWYRGEGIGVAPAKAGGHDHDFGEGMYLTDRKDVAEVYAARRATTPDGRRVYVVTVERSSLGRVLDLSSDARWNHFMNDTSDRYHMGKSRLDYVKIKHEVYGKYFNDFLALHKIDIKSYDAVIGPEYNFRSAIDELYWYEEILANPFLHKSDVDRLLTEKRDREQWMEETFGPFPIPPVRPKQRRYAIGNWFDDD